MYRKLFEWIKDKPEKKKVEKDIKFYECVHVYKKLLKKNKDTTGFL